MKQTMRYISVLALLMCNLMTWADDKVVIVAPSNGTVTANNVNPAASATVTLTVTPAAGYYIEKSDITVVKTISADHATTRTDPGYNEPIALTGDDPADLSTERNYTFTMPADVNYNIKITANFKARTSMTAAMIEDIANQGYTGEQIKPTVVVKDGTTTLVITTDYTVSYGENINVATGGSVTVTGQSKYMGSAEKTFVITKAASAVTTAPTAIEDLVYNGSNQALINDNGVAANGTLHYSLNGTSYSTTIPTGKDAKAYTVYYKVVGDENHTDTDPATISVSIAKKGITVSGIKAKNKEYDGGTTATLDYSSVVFTGIEDGDALTVSTTGTFEDASLGEGKTVTLGTLTLGGTSVANYKLAETGQQTTTTANITQAVLNAATLNSKITLSSTSIGYTGEPVAPTVTIDGMTEGTDYEVKYKSGDAEATATKPTNNGTYTIVIVGKGNYTGEVVTSKTFQITKAAAAVATAPTAKTGLVDNGEYQELITAGSGTNGTMQYSLDNKTYSTAIPKGKDAGTYTVYYKVVGNANYADTEAKTLTVTIAEAQSNILDASKHFTIGSYTFYELTTEALAAIKNTIKANVALSSAADSRTRVTDDGGLCFSKGEDIYMAVRNLKRHDVVIVVFTGTLYGDSYHLEKKNGTRSVGDMQLESGVEYDVITAGDMILTIKPREGEVNIKSIIIKSAPSTAIDGVEADNNTDRWFDLNGIPIDQPLKKGIYIKNGKKVIYK